LIIELTDPRAKISFVPDYVAFDYKGELLPTVSEFYILGQILEIDIDDMLVVRK